MTWGERFAFECWETPKILTEGNGSTVIVLPRIGNEHKRSCLVHGIEFCFPLAGDFHSDEQFLCENQGMSGEMENAFGEEKIGHSSLLDYHLIDVCKEACKRIYIAKWEKRSKGTI